MLLNDVVKEVGMTKRAVKYYEEKGLLTVNKDAMDRVNERICRELGLYYDANYNLKIKKDKRGS